MRVRAGFPGWTTEWLVIPFARRTALAAWNWGQFLRGLIEFLVPMRHSETGALQAVIYGSKEHENDVGCGGR